MVQTISIKKTVEVLETIEQEFPIFLKKVHNWEIFAFYSAESGQRIFKMNNTRSITNNSCGYQDFIAKADMKEYTAITGEEYFEILNECIEFLQLENLMTLQIAV